MLDNTVIVYLSDGAEAHHSRCWEWPMVVIGNIGGRLKTGRYIDYPDYGQPGHRTIANMYVTLLHLAGSSRDSFGMADPGLKDFNQHGPLEEQKHVILLWMSGGPSQFETWRSAVRTT